MAVSMTEAQVRDRSKTETRRLGWRNAKPGDQVTLCRKVMGRREGDPLVRIVAVEFTDVAREPLEAITPEGVAAEGFPDWTPEQFVAFFCEGHRGATPSSEVTRIRWRYLDPDGLWDVVDFRTECPETREPIGTFREALDYIADIEGCHPEELTWGDKEGASWTVWGEDLSNTGMALRHASHRGRR